MGALVAEMVRLRGEFERQEEKQRADVVQLRLELDALKHLELRGTEPRLERLQHRLELLRAANALDRVPGRAATAASAASRAKRDRDGAVSDAMRALRQLLAEAENVTGELARRAAEMPDLVVCVRDALAASGEEASFAALSDLMKLSAKMPDRVVGVRDAVTALTSDVDRLSQFEGQALQ